MPAVGPVNGGRRSAGGPLWAGCLGSSVGRRCAICVMRIGVTNSKASAPAQIFFQISDPDYVSSSWISRLLGLDCVECCDFMNPSSHAAAGPAVNVAPSLVAVTVMRDGLRYAMCPFFAKCDGILVIDLAKAEVKFVANAGRTVDAMCACILDSSAAQLICGFLPESARTRLQTAGLDVRLGSCACEVDELVVQFAGLPKA